MKFYIEITLLNSIDIDINFLWTKLYQQLHLGLVEMQDAQRRVPIGVSFPEYVTGGKCSLLGCKLRLFANDEATLIKFNIAKWLSRLSDYVHCTSIRQVPEKIAGYAIYQREQIKTNKKRLAKRYAKRHDADYEVVLEKNYNNMIPKKATTPFISLKSLSSDHEFCLSIKKTLANKLSGDTYSSYGLSSTSSVPEF